MKNNILMRVKTRKHNRKHNPVMVSHAPSARAAETRVSTNAQLLRKSRRTSPLPPIRHCPAAAVMGDRIRDASRAAPFSKQAGPGTRLCVRLATYRSVSTIAGRRLPVSPPHTPDVTVSSKPMAARARTCSSAASCCRLSSSVSDHTCGGWFPSQRRH